MTDEKNPSGSSLDATRIDLGEDLLEKTAIIPGLATPTQPNGVQENHPGVVPSYGPGSIADQLQSARILLNEGLSDDAKKILRQVLVSDPGNAFARQTLNELQESELQQIFRGGDSQRPYRRRTELLVEKVDSEFLMRQLDKDLNLGVFSESQEGSIVSQLSLFQSEELMDSFCTTLEKQLMSFGARDWIDLGIAFLEMELYSVAIRLFSGAWRRTFLENSDEKELSLSATCLLALALILAGRSFEAVPKIQALLRDADIQRENKIELFYLMGRTYESMQKMEHAVHFYKQVVEIDSDYRDVSLRLFKKIKE